MRKAFDAATVNSLMWNGCGLRLLTFFVYKQPLVVLPVCDHDPDLFPELIDEVRPKHAYVLLFAGLGELDQRRFLGLQQVDQHAAVIDFPPGYVLDGPPVRNIGQILLKLDRTA